MLVIFFPQTIFGINKKYFDNLAKVLGFRGEWPVD